MPAASVVVTCDYVVYLENKWVKNRVCLCRLHRLFDLKSLLRWAIYKTLTCVGLCCMIDLTKQTIKCWQRHSYNSNVISSKTVIFKKNYKHIWYYNWKIIHGIYCSRLQDFVIFVRNSLTGGYFKAQLFETHNVSTHQLCDQDLRLMGRNVVHFKKFIINMSFYNVIIVLQKTLFNGMNETRPNYPPLYVTAYVWHWDGPSQ